MAPDIDPSSSPLNQGGPVPPTTKPDHKSFWDRRRTTALIGLLMASTYMYLPANSLWWDRGFLLEMGLHTPPSLVTYRITNVESLLPNNTPKICQNKAIHEPEGVFLIRRHQRSCFVVGLLLWLGLSAEVFSRFSPNARLLKRDFPMLNIFSG